ncbi:MAG: hypothetical protein Q7U60_10210 [Candidatus Methanoperedens sp.]|nr:hypothetical protein [Candidatus Methanoperedens sp.]
MKVSHILFYLVLISLFSVPVSADLNIESASVIETGDKEAWGPAWSPDGNSIAYIAYDNSRNQQIFTINIDSTGKKQVTNDTIRKWGIEWMQDEISFISYDTDGLQKIFLVKPDGSGRRKLLDDRTRQGRDPDDKPPLLGGASWNQDTKQILFTSFDDRANEKIYLVNPDGTGKKRLITDEFRQWNPVWSQEGNSFVYVSYDNLYHEQLFSANADGSGKKQVTSDELKKSDPNWGTEGILYVSYETASSIGSKIFIINPDGTGKKLLVKDGFKQRNPRWSRDGTKMLYEDITTRGNLSFNVLNLQKPAVATPVAAPSEPSTPPAPTPELTITPIVTQQTPPPTQTPPLPPPVEESPANDALKEVVYSMLLVLGLIVALMLVFLFISNILNKKK